MKKWLGFLLCGLLFGGLAGGSAQAQWKPFSSSVVGRWVPEQGGTAPRGFPDNLELLKDGTGIYEKYGMKWTAENGRLIIRADVGEARGFSYQISGSTLILTDDNGENVKYITLEAARKAAEEEARKAAAEEAAEEAAQKAAYEKAKRELAAKTVTNSIGMEFVPIPAGTFMMGDKNYGPAHQVTISKPFYLGKFEVTQEQWEAVMGNNPSEFKGRSNPVERVSWEDVEVFIQKLNQKEGGKKYRLPTEAEWEYAARARSKTEYFFGDDPAALGQYAWSRENSNGTTHPVGEKKPNPWGLYDIYGNVYEWVADWYGDYKAGAVTDSTGPASGSARVNRGGSWNSAAGNCRSAARYGDDAPGYRLIFLGFRLAFSPE